MRAILVLVTLLAATVAGCMGDDEPEGEGSSEGRGRGYEGLNLKPADANELEREFEAIQIVAEDDPEWDRPNTTRDDWLLLSTTMSEQGSVVAFEWEFPKEAVVSNSRTGGEVLALDFVIAVEPMGESGSLPEGVDWMMLVFYEQLDEDDGWQIARAGSEWGATFETTEISPTGEPEVTTRAALSNPFIMRVGAGEEAGDKVYFVLAARGPSESPFAVGVRNLPQQAAARESSPTGNWKEFASLVEARDVPPFVPERVAENQGLFLGSHSEERIQGQNDRFQRTFDMPPPSESIPDETGGAVAPPCSTEITTSVDWGGWSSVDIRYANSPSWNTWEVSGSIHGHEATRSVALVSQTSRVCQAMVEGTGGAQIQNSILNAGTPTSEVIRYEHLSVNMHMESLTGMPYRTFWNCS